MAKSSEHISQSNHNQDVINQLSSHPAPFWDWVVVVAFYKAVHIAEAVFYESEVPPHMHSAAHKDRGILLKTKYPDLWRNYWHLFKASKIARYLEFEEGGVTHEIPKFSDDMPGNVVTSLLLGQYLVRFEASASAYLSDPTGLKRFTPPSAKSSSSS